MTESTQPTSDRPEDDGPTWSPIDASAEPELVQPVAVSDLPDSADDELPVSAEEYLIEQTEDYTGDELGVGDADTDDDLAAGPPDGR